MGTLCCSLTLLVTRIGACLSLRPSSAPLPLPWLQHKRGRAPASTWRFTGVGVRILRPGRDTCPSVRLDRRASTALAGFVPPTRPRYIYFSCLTAGVPGGCPFADAAHGQELLPIAVRHPASGRAPRRSYPEPAGRKQEKPTELGGPAGG